MITMVRYEMWVEIETMKVEQREAERYSQVMRSYAVSSNQRQLI